MTTYYVNQNYEVKNGVVTKYYFAGATRLAVRTGGTLSFLLSDHIGSSSLTTDANGATIGESLYKAFGESRYLTGTLNTDYKFTGQREEASLGIYFFQSRWFDPSLGRFTQPDSIVPTSTQGTQAWDRYAFVNNNPVRYNDPTGHWAIGDDDRSHEQGHTDPCARYGYDSPECRKYLNLPEPPKKIDEIIPKDDDVTQEPDLSSTNPPNLSSPNPPVVILVVLGVIITVVGILADIPATIAELIALPPPLDVLVPFVITMALVDLEVAYWSYVYRVVQDPQTPQTIELAPPWGWGE